MGYRPELDTSSDNKVTATVTVTGETIAGNTISTESTFTRADSSTGRIVDAWFTYDNVNTTYAQDYTLGIRTLFLPTLRGYGNMPDLHIAMSLDEELLGMVGEVVAFRGWQAATHRCMGSITYC